MSAESKRPGGRRLSQTGDLPLQFRRYLWFNLTIATIGIGLGVASRHLGIGVMIASLSIAAILAEYWKLRVVALEVVVSDEGIAAVTGSGVSIMLTWQEVEEVRRFPVLRPLIAFEVVRLVPRSRTKQIVVTSLIEKFDWLVSTINLRASQARQPTKLYWWEKLYGWGLL